VKSFGWARERPLAQLNRISASQCPSLVPTEAPREICATTPEEDWDVYAAIAGEIQKSAARQLIYYELVASTRVAGGAGRNDSPRECCSRCRAADRNNAIALEADGAAAEGPLQCRGLEGIPDYRINGTYSEEVHGAAARHAEGAGISSPPVLHSQIGRHPRDRDH
jgi:hypothetical protein